LIMRVQSPRKIKQRRIVRISAAGLLLVWLMTLVPDIVSSVSAVALKPVYAVERWLNNSSSLIPVFIRDRVKLEKEIETLKQELATAGRRDITEQRLWEENNRLRAMLSADGKKRIAAAVVARPDQLPYDLLQIDQGSRAGVEVGAPVFIGKDAVIGLVVYTTEQYSFVELVTSPEFKASVFVSGPNVVAEMEGRGGGVARVKMPQGLTLRSGDMVYLTSVEPGVYGRISYVEDHPTQPEQYGYITPDIPINSIYQVAIGEKSQIAESPAAIDDNLRKIMRTVLLKNGSRTFAPAATGSTTTDEAAVNI